MGQNVSCCRGPRTIMEGTQGTANMAVVPLPSGAAWSQVDQGGETKITKNEITKRSTVQQLMHKDCDLQIKTQL